MRRETKNFIGLGFFLSYLMFVASLAYIAIGCSTEHNFSPQIESVAGWLMYALHFLSRSADRFTFGGVSDAMPVALFLIETLAWGFGTAWVIQRSIALLRTSRG